MTTMEVVGLIVLSYIAGSMPFGYWFGKIINGPDYDIRDHGSNSIGATNAFRVLGWRIGLPVFILDAFKGYGPALLGMKMVNPAFGGICLILAGIGHAFSLYFFWKEGKFSGGKSVATYFGGLLALQPIVAMVGLAVFIVVVASSRYVSLGSMLGVVGALVCGCLMRLAAPWIVILSAMTLMIIVFHRRNIARLIEGCENKLGQKAEETDSTSSFLLHGKDFSQFDLTRITKAFKMLIDRGWVSERQARNLIVKSPILEVGEITGIEYPDGTTGRVLLEALPMLADQIKDPANLPALETLMPSGAVLAKRRGASVYTLGALTSSFGRGGQDLQDWCDKRRLGLTVDNGAGATAAATVEVMEELLPESLPLTECTIAIVGASGIIGHILWHYFCRRQVKELILVGRDERKMEDMAAKAAVITTDLARVSEADVVICTTSAADYIFTKENANLIKHGAVVIDVAIPYDFDDAILKTRPDIQLARSGLILLPGDFQCNMDFGFGEIETKWGIKYLVPACLAQSQILAKTREFGYASRLATSVSADAIDFYRKWLRLLGMKVIVSRIAEPVAYGLAKGH
ncbi:MAG: glycerol-3-phosphate 1-O-acyltransferase PlsY [Candidatus Berkelbacteria bacterium]